MLTRALIVLLVILNVGVGAWWFWHDPPPPEAPPPPATGIARLQLLSERDGPATPSPAAPQTAAAPGNGVAGSAPATPPAIATATETAPAAPTTAPGVCFSVGPFADAAQAATAERALRAQATRTRTRSAQVGSGRGWRVYLPPAADRATADAAADRLKAAGFTDLLVVGNGAEANSVALGRFSTEARARQHAERLQAAGFAARAEPVGEVRSELWIDIAAPAGFRAGDARRLSGAAQARPQDCAPTG